MFSIKRTAILTAEMFTQIRREGDRSKPLLLLDDLRPPPFHFPEFLNIFISFSCSKCFKGMLKHFGKFADCHNSHNNCINYVTSWHLKQCIHQTGFCLRRRKESCKEIIITTNHTLHCDQTSYSFILLGIVLMTALNMYSWNHFPHQVYLSLHIPLLFHCILTVQVTACTSVVELFGYLPAHVTLGIIEMGEFAIMLSYHFNDFILVWPFTWLLNTQMKGQGGAH